MFGWKPIDFEMNDNRYNPVKGRVDITSNSKVTLQLIPGSEPVVLTLAQVRALQFALADAARFLRSHETSSGLHDRLVAPRAPSKKL